MRPLMRTIRPLFLLLLAVAGLAACQRAGDKSDKAGKATDKAGSGSASGSGSAEASPVKDIDSKDILARTEVAAESQVKHVLIGWKELEPVYGARMDKRAKERSNADAAKLAQEVLAKLRANPDSIDAVSKELSEDPGSQTGSPYVITANASFVPEFKNLSLRLKEKEVGIVKTQFGYHVIERVPPPPPDPLESTDILARPAPATPETAHIQHIQIGWKGSQDPRAANRTKEDADAIAKVVLDKVRNGGDMAALMKEFSEDANSKDTGKVYDVPAAGDDPAIRLSARLALGEAGMIKSPNAWHIIKRVPPPPPPPPDALDSVDILKREPVTKASKVKHILLGWKEVNSGDPRATARDRKALEALVKKTIGRLKKGEKIEALMKELSEDPGSAASGNSYDVTPDAGLVQPFKDLGLRLNVGEIGAVKTQFGIHIIQRTE